jgi:hypothetical protein
MSITGSLSGIELRTGYHISKIVTNPLNPKLVQVAFKILVRTAKKTPHFTITKINWFLLFEEVITVYGENHAKPKNTKVSVTDY